MKVCKRAESVERHIVQDSPIDIRLTQELAEKCCKHSLWPSSHQAGPDPRQTWTSRHEHVGDYAMTKGDESDHRSDILQLPPVRAYWTKGHIERLLQRRTLLTDRL